MLYFSTTVFLAALSLWTMIAKEVKETIHLVLDHGFHFVELDGGLTPDTWLQEMLSYCKWSLESIALLLRRQGKGGLPIQHLNGCLHLVIFYSDSHDPDERSGSNPPDQRRR